MRATSSLSFMVLAICRLRFLGSQAVSLSTPGMWERYRGSGRDLLAGLLHLSELEIVCAPEALEQAGHGSHGRLVGRLLRKAFRIARINVYPLNADQKPSGASFLERHQRRDGAVLIGAGPWPAGRYVTTVPFDSASVMPALRKAAAAITTICAT